MNKVIFILLVLSVQKSLSDVPTSQNCTGEHEYRDADGTCKMCEKCPKGQQPKGLCAYGEREVDFRCETCPEGSYSLHNDFNLCVRCDPCSTWNSEYRFTCEPDRNSVCGRCLAGYFRPLKSDGKPDDECHPCSSAKKEIPECEEKYDRPWPETALIVVPILIFVIVCLVVVVICFCCYHQRSRKKGRCKRGACRLRDPERSSSIPDSVSQSIGDSRSDFGVEQKSLVSIESPETKPSHRVTPLLVSESNGPAKMGATRSLQFHSHQHYSNLPTREYEDPAHDQPTASNMSTEIFQDPGPVLHPANARIVHLQNIGNGISPPPMVQTQRYSSRRHRADITSSNENLLEHVDRDSKTPESDIEPDSFDTRSYVSEVTKPLEAYRNP